MVIKSSFEFVSTPAVPGWHGLGLLFKDILFGWSEALGIAKNICCPFLFHPLVNVSQHKF